MRAATVYRLEAALHRHFAPRDELLHVAGEQQQRGSLLTTPAVLPRSCLPTASPAARCARPPPPPPPLQAAYDTGKDPIRKKRVDLRQFGVLRGTAPPGDMTLLDSLTNGSRAEALTATDPVSRAAFFLEPRPAWRGELKVSREAALLRLALLSPAACPFPAALGVPRDRAGGPGRLDRRLHRVRLLGWGGSRRRAEDRRGHSGGLRAAAVMQRAAVYSR